MLVKNDITFEARTCVTAGKGDIKGRVKLPNSLCSCARDHIPQVQQVRAALDMFSPYYIIIRLWQL